MITEKISKSKILFVSFLYTVLQFLMILIFPSEDISWVFTLIITIPLLFVSYCAMQLNKVAYVLLTYWYFLQIFSLRMNDSWSYELKYGVHFNINFLDNMIGINPLVFILFILVMLEVDVVFPELLKDELPIESLKQSGDNNEKTA